MVKSSGVDLDAVAKTTATVAKTATDGAFAAKPVVEQVRRARPSQRVAFAVQQEGAHGGLSEDPQG